MGKSKLAKSNQKIELKNFFLLNQLKTAIKYEFYTNFQGESLRVSEIYQMKETQKDNPRGESWTGFRRRVAWKLSALNPGCLHTT